jgi:ABC-type nickel/cobalt efflux system permease component RcnA
MFDGVNMASHELTDRFGSVASTLCALHCGVCAFLPVAFSAFGLGFLLSEQTEWLFSIVAIIFGLGALFFGWRMHRSKRVAAFLIVGVLGIMTSRALEMGSDHHHDGDAHHSADSHVEGGDGPDAHESDHQREAHADEHGDHEDHHDDEEDIVHLAGALVGVFAGFILLFGHLSNIRAARRYRETHDS